MKLICKKLGLAQTIGLSDWYSEDLLKSDKSYQSNYRVGEEIKSLYSKLKKALKNFSKGLGLQLGLRIHV